MKKVFPRLLHIMLLFTLSFITTDTKAQLWDDHVDRTFVFRIDNKEAEKLLQSSIYSYDTVIHKMLHTQVGTFTGEWDEQPEQGHFIYADIERNQVSYRYSPVMPFRVFLYKEYGILNMQVVDMLGNIRSDAKVRIKGKRKLFNKRVGYDAESQVYRVDDWSEKRYRLLTVELNGFRALFDLTKHIVRPYPNWGGDDFYSPDFYSYMITDKNKYKPGETVRFKSYALTGSRRPMRKELEVWLRTSDYRRKKIGTLLPYNPGGYAGGMQIHDSLEMRLDATHTIELREPKGRIVATRSFRYEDYVLYDNKLEVEISDKVHYFPDDNELTIKVTDANGLLALDVKADVLVRRRHIHTTFTDILNMPDTLMHQQISLDNGAPTKVVIPADIFGPANGAYQVEVNVLTYDGQAMTFNDIVTYRHQWKEMEVSTHGDTVRFEYFETGKPVHIRAHLRYDGKGTPKWVDLPYEEKFDQKATSYEFHIPDRGFTHTIAQSRIEPGLYFEGGIEHDSVRVRLVNPLELEATWYIYRGNVLVEKGAGKEMTFSAHEPEHDVAWYAESFFFMGDNEEGYRRAFYPLKDQLTIELDMPDRVYPGQTVDGSITVTDHLGHPATKTDLTAFAFNNLLDYYVPDMEYYGPQPRTREERSSYSIDRRGYTFRSRLNYRFWKERARLDSLPYYRFIYPNGELFRHTVDTPDGITQFAPYIMLNGQSVEIKVIEINNEPVWFSWSEQPQAFSFPVEPDRPNNIRLRTPSHAIILDSMYFERGKKTIFSFDYNNLPPEAKVMTLGRGMTSVEYQRYRSLLSRLPVSGRNNIHNFYYKDGDSVLVYHPLLSGQTDGYVLTGPLKPGMSRYHTSPEYMHEGGYRYNFKDNVVYKHDSDVLDRNFDYLTSTNEINNLSDFYLSPIVIDRKVEHMTWRKRYWQPSAIRIEQRGMLLNFDIPRDADTTGIVNLVFIDHDSASVIFPGRSRSADERSYPEIRPGMYDAMLIFNNGRYIRCDSISFMHNTATYVDMGAFRVNEADSLSLAWRNKYALFIDRSETFRPSSGTQIFYMRAPDAYMSRITGVVKDAEGEPLIGVNVLIKGTQYGTITDIDGNFVLNVATGTYELVVSYLGFNTYETTASTGTHLNITLEEDYQTLSEVVVVGYGTRYKAMMTGAVSTVSSNSMMQAPAEEFDEDDVPLTADAEAEDRLYQELLAISGLRSNFSDVGFWEPSLVTDRKGKAEFSVTFPDNITRWDAVVYAMNRRLKTGTYRKSIRSYKPLMAELRMPGFLVEGDVSTFAGNLRNYTSSDSVTGVATFTHNSDTLSSQTVTFGTSLPAHIDFTAPTGHDSLKASYTFVRDDGYLDGEERTINIVPRGTEIAMGTLGFLREGESAGFTADNNENVEIIVTAQQIDIYMDAAYYLHRYEHACNEQLASKLIGLLNIRLYNTYKGEGFDYDRQVNDIIRRLVNNRNSLMLWSWWGNSDNTSYWMSAHIMRALKMARDQGYTVNLDWPDMTLSYTHLEGYRPPRLEDIQILHVLSEWGLEHNYLPAVEYWEKEIAREEHRYDSLKRANKNPEIRIPRRSYLNEKLMLWDIRRMQGQGFEPDSVRRYLKTDVMGGVYCDDGINRNWYNNEITTTLAAYKIVRADSSLMHYKEAMQLHVLGTKGSGWNTYYSANALSAIFPDLITATGSGARQAVLQLTGQDNGNVSEFPYRTTLQPGESLTLSRAGGVPLIYSAYTRRLVTEERTGDAFEVRTIIPGDSILQTGKPVTLHVTVNVKQNNAEYVMIEVPIPAGCDYASKNQSRYSGETYREHYKEKTLIYCERMPVGLHSFRIELLPRFSGTYTLNPAKAELMYFPVVSANNDLREISLQ